MVCVEVRGELGLSRVGCSNGPTKAVGSSLVTLRRDVEGLEMNDQAEDVEIVPAVHTVSLSMFFDDYK